jgi:hypothetical protein
LCTPKKIGSRRFFEKVVKNWKYNEFQATVVKGTVLAKSSRIFKGPENANKPVFSVRIRDPGHRFRDKAKAGFWSRENSPDPQH